MDKGLVVLSLFDGMSCGQLALQRAGIKVKKYLSSEIDKHAIKVTLDNFPDTVCLGDVTDWESWGLDFSEIDLVIAGSPCQGFSFAGKQLAFDDPRSKLFFTFVDILNECKLSNPNVKFLLENVRMKKEHQEVITEYMGVEPLRDGKGKPYWNSALLSAQNRVRIYWTNIEGLVMPEDKGVLFGEIKENQVTPNTASWHKWFFKNKEYQLKKKYCKILKDGDKSICMVARQFASYNGNLVCIRKNVYRFLTPIECERLQTVPDNYTACVSNTQRYKMLGSGWTIDMIVHILKGLL